jgi:hypothetical protein
MAIGLDLYLLRLYIVELFIKEDLMSKKTGDFLMILFFGLCVLMYRYFSGNINESYEDEIENLNINSLVTKKFIDYSNHGIPYVVHDNDSIIIYREWEDKIAVGDSIIKPKGSSLMTIKNTDKLINFDYKNPIQGLPNS